MNPSVIITADMHMREDSPVCRMDDYMKAQKSKLGWLDDLSIRSNCPILDAGDLLNKWKPSPWLLRWLLIYLPDGIITIPGNHDLPNHSMDSYDRSGLSVLEQAGKVMVLKENLYQYNSSNSFTVFGIPYGSELSNKNINIATSHRSDGIYTVIILHTMCYQDKPPYPGAEKEGGNAKSILKKYPDFDLIITGHNHQSFAVQDKGRWLVNPGSMMRMTANQIDHKPSVYLWDADQNKIERKEIPIKQNIITREHIKKVGERDDRIDAFVTRLKGEVELSLSFESNLAKYIKRNDVSKPVEKIIWDMMN